MGQLNYQAIRKFSNDAGMRGMQGQYYQYQNGFLDRASVDLTLHDIADGIYQNWEQFGLLDNIEIQDGVQKLIKR